MNKSYEYKRLKHYLEFEKNNVNGVFALYKFLKLFGISMLIGIILYFIFK